MSSLVQPAESDMSRGLSITNGQTAGETPSYGDHWKIMTGLAAHDHLHAREPPCSIVLANRGTETQRAKRSDKRCNYAGWHEVGALTGPRGFPGGGLVGEGS